MPGKKYASIRRPKVYEALREKGMSKERAAKISNAKAKKKSSLGSSPGRSASAASRVGGATPGKSELAASRTGVAPGRAIAEKAKAKAAEKKPKR
jgi:hypothetical protein